MRALTLLQRHAGALAALALVLTGTPAGADDAKHMLWEVQGKNNRVYLLGSIHLLREKDHPLPAPMQAAYEDAETLALEIDLTALDPLQILSTTRAYAMPDDGRTLRDFLGPPRYATAQRLAGEMGLDLGLLGNVEPWFAALTAMQIQLSKLNFSAALGVDPHFAKKAARDGKPVIGMESLEDQLRLFDELPPEVQNDFFIATLAEYAELETQMDALLGAWRSGDSETLARLLLDELEDYPRLYDALVVKRNTKWLTRVRDWLEDDDDVLLVAGAAHLVGTDGLVRALRSEGYRVTQR